MSKKLTTCKACGQEISQNAKACPHCGAKNKMPIFKKWWFWTIVVVLIIVIATPGNKADSNGAANNNPTNNQSGTSNQNGTTEPAKTKYYVGIKSQVWCKIYAVSKPVSDKNKLLMN